MFNRIKSGFDPFSLVIGILAIGLSFLILRNPTGSLQGIVWVFAVMSIVEGILKVIELSGVSIWAVLSGILNIIIGIILLFQPIVGAYFIGILVAVWFIIDSLYELYFSQALEKTHKGYFWLIVILGVIGVIFGIILLFHPVLTAGFIVFLVAFYFMFFGILLIIRSF